MDSVVVVNAGSHFFAFITKYLSSIEEQFDQILNSNISYNTITE